MTKNNEHPYSYCGVAGATDVGRVRKANEDWHATFDSPNGRVVVICDGMGGHVGGKIASHTAVDAIRTFLVENQFDDPDTAISEAIKAANIAVLKKAEADPALTGMGSTCVLLIVKDGKVHYGWVGDSRIYLVRNNTITQLSKDESYVQMLVDNGVITREEMESHPRKNEITNALGIRGMTPAQIGERGRIPQAGDSYVLCSDGLSGMMSDDDIRRIVANKKDPASERVNKLVALALKNGGKDNITVDILEFSMTPPGLEDEAPRRGLSSVTTAICSIFVVLAALGLYFILRHNSGDNRPTESFALSEVDLGKGNFVSLLEFHPEDAATMVIQLAGARDTITIGEGISKDSVETNYKQIETHLLNGENFRLSLKVPNIADSIPEKIIVLLRGKHRKYALSIPVKKGYISGRGDGQAKRAKTNASGTTDNLSTDAPAGGIAVGDITRGDSKTTTYRTGSDKINIVAVKHSFIRDQDGTLNIGTTSQIIKKANEDNSEYKVEYITNREGLVSKCQITIKDKSTPHTINILTKGEKLVIDYTPLLTDPN